MNSLIIRLLCAALLCVYVQGYAFYFASEGYCSVSLAVGQTIMGATVQSGNSRSIVVKRNGVALTSGASYAAGETLTVSISSSDVEYAIQVASGDAVFSGGACNQKRISDGSGSLVMPSTGTVTLNGGSASSEGTVKMTSNFVLNCCQSTSPTKKPTVAPSSRSPTAIPSIVPSLVPSVLPTHAPTVKPSVSAAPVTGTPTSVGTPSVRPTIQPTATPTVKPTTSLPSNPPFISPSVVPTEAPSAGPTYLSKTLLTFSISQVLYNISAIDIDVEAAAGLEDALMTSLEHFQDPTDVTLSSVDNYDLTVDFPFNSRRITISSASTAILVSYAVTYLLEDTQYATSSALQDALSISVNLISNSNLFLGYLASENVPVLHTITSTSSAGNPTLSSTVVEQSVSPTHGPTFSPYDSDDKFYQGQLADKIIVGLIVGLFGVVLSVGLLSYYVKNHVSILAKGAAYTTLPAVSAIVCGLIALILVSVWATKKRDNDMLYLGVPNWKTNVFAWHPVLMVAGLFFCQVVAISDWVFFTTKDVGKNVHVLLQTAGLATMIAALCAVVKYKLDNKTPHVNSMHAWIGVGAVIAFCSNYIFGFSMGLLTALAPDSSIHKSYPLLFMHRALGLTSLGLCTVAIIAGIMDQLPQGACFYTVGSPFQADFDPAENYPYLRGSCQIAHGLGITVILAAAFCVLAVVLRDKFKTKSRLVNILDQRIAMGEDDGAAGVVTKPHVVEFFY